MCWIHQRHGLEHLHAAVEVHACTLQRSCLHLGRSLGICGKHSQSHAQWADPDCMMYPLKQKTRKHGIQEMLVKPDSSCWQTTPPAVLQGLPGEGVLYSYRVDGPQGWEKGNRFDPKRLLVDPYAPLLEGRRVFGDSSQKMAPFYGTFDFVTKFDWGTMASESASAT